jgi:hypothetical protein
MVKSKLMFAVHEGAGGVAKSSSVWPLAMSDRVYSGPPESYEELAGFWALWQMPDDWRADNILRGVAWREFAECAFDACDLVHGGSPDGTVWNRIWVYEVNFDQSTVADETDNWTHLRGGTFRRPTPEELSAVTGGSARDWQVVL